MNVYLLINILIDVILSCNLFKSIFYLFDNEFMKSLEILVKANSFLGSSWLSAVNYT